MQRSLATELKSKSGSKVMVQGWLHNVRSMGKLNFLLIRDRSGIVQAVITSKTELDKLTGLQPGTVLSVEGTVTQTENTDLGVEITEPIVEVLVPITEVSPIVYNKKDVDASLDLQLDYRPLVLRNPKSQSIFKVQATIMRSFAEAMRNEGFMEFRSPVLMGAPSESGADVFEVKYFDGKAYLAQSPQVYKQIMVGVFERAFTIATVFRAEKHNTSRHLMEITQMDGEMGFISSYHEVLEVVERVIRYILKNISEQNAADINLWGIELPKLPEGRFPMVKVKEALQIIEKRTGKSAVREELDVDPDDEREIAKWALEEHASDFVWLLNFKKNKNFYTWNNPADADESLSYDLECRGLEWLSGTHRIHDYPLLMERFKQQGLSEEYYEHYLQAFKYGIPSEAGFSLGLERMTKQIFGLENVREATLFPSDLKRIAGQRIVTKGVFGADKIKKAIKELFIESDLAFEVSKHAPTPTSEDSAAVRDLPLESGIKALILREKKSNQNLLVAIPADKKLDIAAVNEEYSKKQPGAKFEFEKPEIISERFGLEVGGVPPVGHVFGLETWLDSSILTKQIVAFNNADKSESIICSAADFAKVVKSQIGSFTK